MAGSGVGAAADMEGRDRSGIFSGDIADVDILYKVATSGLHHAWWCSWETQTLMGNTNTASKKSERTYPQIWIV